MTDLMELLYGDGVITSFQPGLPIDRLVHRYEAVRLDSRGDPIDFAQVSRLLAAVRSDVEAWYGQKTKSAMNTYALGEYAQPVRERFWDDARFAHAFSILELPYDKRQLATIPWWNEIAGGELGFEYDGTTALLSLGPRHSLETQLMRAGIPRPVKNVSVGGIILSKPERQMILGLRGGGAYSNTYHINAGALMVTQDFKEGLTTIFDHFRDGELTPEFGIMPEQIVSVGLGSRIVDEGTDKGTMYTFHVYTNLTARQLMRQWETNLDADRGEHDSPLLLAESEVARFIRANYRGIVANRQDRQDSERYLLHPGALALAAFAGMQPSELRALYQPGIW